MDQFKDIFISSDGGFSIDDVYGNSIFSNLYTGYQITSIALGNGNVYGFYNGAFLVGNGSYALRTSGLQFVDGPSGSTNTVAGVCAEGFCWYADSVQDQVIFANGNVINYNLGYSPGGLAIDVLRNRMFVSDPTHNQIHLYNLSTMALEKTLE